MNDRPITHDNGRLERHEMDTGKLFKWRRRFNTYVMECRPDKLEDPRDWAKHNVVLRGRDAYFSYLDGKKSKTIHQLSQEGYDALMRAILLGGLKDG